MLPFQTENFEPEIDSSSHRKRDYVLASNPVEIMTLYRKDEPIPTVYSEPPKAFNIRCVDPDNGSGDDE